MGLSTFVSASDIDITDDGWTKSSFSTPTGNCVEFAKTPAGGIAMRNSTDPDGAAFVYNGLHVLDIAAFIKGAKSGDFDQFLSES